MAANKPYTDKYWLEDQYVRRNRTIGQIVEQCKLLGCTCTEMTIFNWIKRFNLKPDSRDLGKRNIGSKGKGYYG